MTNNQFDFDKSTKLYKLDSDGNRVFMSDVMLELVSEYTESNNTPSLVAFNGMDGYYKNSMASTQTFDHFEIVISAIGKKLGIRTAETYHVIQDGVQKGIISENVAPLDDRLYEISEIASSDIVDLSKVSAMVEELGLLREKADVRYGDVPFLDNMDDIEKVVKAFPQLISSSDIITSEEEALIEKDYYKMIILDLMTGNVDRNMKNYAIVHGANGSIRFSPLFDSSTIDIPGFPKMATQVNGFLFDSVKLLDCLYTSHYDEIKELTGEILDHQEENKAFISKIGNSELDENEQRWLLDRVMSRYDYICDVERKYRAEHNCLEAGLAYGAEYTREEMSNMSLSELNALENGEPVLTSEEATAQNANDNGVKMVTIIMVLGLVMSGAAALYLNLLI